ncbi:MULTISPECIES: glutamate ABC transporter substrate-binding protein [Nocardioides]|uniref:Glutamate transport system substrate-binding protein n=1 Tax=Nocardioides lianchengensis TaxID=1045774 RepID=A0A1G6Z8S9_9ACTN|nr:glutamate ABC transporter substrate-binding protein [Nocardioides lianchengensis]NYG11470.1 glutamate transport system substrate-binding protein [Nocardioides lianchengensis]SDD99144.1 glutamate transport system substrate-binding protein [Nocardioides lianchengensis]
MRRTRFGIAAAGVLLAGMLTACGDAGSDDEGRDVEAKENAADEFDAGTRMKELAEAGKITVGVKYDQPGLGFKGANDDIPSGFDVEIAKLLVADLGIDPADTSVVTYEETISDNREPFLESGKVDLVLASYSITDDRRKVVGQTGPYFVTGQQLLVPADSDVASIDDLKGQEVCSVTGSTSIDRINEAGAKGVGFDSYSECVQKVLDGTVQGMSTDGSILAGYAAENEGQLKVVGDEFSEELIGVGYSKEHPEMCEWINDVLEDSFEDGSWAEAFELTLGPSGVETPDPPQLQDCVA